MFKVNDEEDYKNGGAEDTIIGSAIKVEGDLVSSGNIIVEGEVSGSIKTDKDLRVGEKAKITAEVNAREAFIAGKVQGNVKVQNKLELSATAEINGDIDVRTLIISAGAVFNGKCTMAEHQTVVTASNSEEREEE
jgi:cytoskeletal protein CcmA (bactofilin family)